MRTLLKLLLSFMKLFGRKPKCHHVFRTTDIANLDIDPECMFCSTRLSDVDGVNLKKK